MWIRSQDGLTLTKVKHLSIRYLNGCYSIFTDNHLAPNEICNLGTYKFKEKALKVLDEIELYIKNQDNKTSPNMYYTSKVFQMPEDRGKL